MSETTEAAAQAGTADDDLRETPATEAPETPQSDDDNETEAPEAEPEEIELSFGAEKLKVLKGAIPPEVLEKLEGFTKGVNGDYTRKTQEVAEQRKAAEAQMEFANKLGSLKGEALTAFSAGQRLAGEIQQLEAVRIDDLWQSDPDQARRISDALVAKRSEFQRQVNTVAQHEAAYDAEQQQFVAKQLDAGRAKMSALVKGFDAQAEADLIQYAVKGGIPEKDAKNWPLNPTTAAMVWKAMQFDRLQARTKAATAASPPAAPAEPVRAVSGKSAASPKNPSTMSMDEYVRWRNSQSARRR